MELVCPAGNVEKLSYAYNYGADTAYIGLKKFSLRVKADNFYEDEYNKVIELKKRFPGKRLFCALNIAFHNQDLKAFEQNLDYFKQYPIDAFILQDLGMVETLQKHFPNAHLHLSTQASCMNKDAVKMYSKIGFKRVVLGREVSLNEIRQIKDANPEIELECFAHGAMCIAYSGRCLLSAYMTGRSAQSGFCSHACRWDYDIGLKGEGFSIQGGKTLTQEQAKILAQSGNLLLQEHKRPGEFFPAFEGENFTAILSSKDLCMIDHLQDLKNAGVDACKIEGRMKSIYYVAMVTRAYRKALDALEGKITQEEASPFIASLSEVPHRECTTGFYYSRANADETTVGASDSPYSLAGTIEKKITGSDLEKVFTNARAMEQSRIDELNAMDPRMQKAIQNDLAQHPQKDIKYAKKIEGYNLYNYNSLNKTDKGTELELISPDVLSTKLLGSDYIFINPKNGAILDWVNPDHDCAIYTKLEIAEGTLVRTKDFGYVEGKIRDTGR
ncbi:U32 family peptidase [Treponema pectinovorum]|uniref:peptidase U32 family protein n=1 Tax=Treponema pectinovorum TaxID=164 RepID=UPI003D925AD8